MTRYEMEKLEFFGNDTQVNLQKRYYRLWPFLKSHPRLSFVGRAIGIDDPHLDEVETLVGLTMELGILSMAFTQATILEELRSVLEENGLEVGLWHHLVLNGNMEPSCRSVVKSIHLPAGYQINRISASTSHHQIQKVQQLMQNCGVAPLPGYILRGRYIPTVAVMIIGSQDEVVATGAGIFRHNPDSPYGKAAHIGFLATEPSLRGKGFGRLLLARIILACYEEHAAELVHTGVRTDNIPSHRVCRICGLEDSGMYMLGASYPQIINVTEFTR